MNWTPFQPASIHLDDINQGWLNKPGARETALELIRNELIFVNNIYQVNIRKLAQPPGFPCDMLHLSIKRRDKAALHDWRDLQRIKNELVNPECEAMEIYPAESRLVDSANQYHLWVFTDPEVQLPLGFTERWVCEESSHGSVQRPFPPDARPADLKSVDQHLAEKEENQ